MLNINNIADLVTKEEHLYFSFLQNAMQIGTPSATESVTNIVPLTDMYMMAFLVCSYVSGLLLDEEVDSEEG